MFKNGQQSLSGETFEVVTPVDPQELEKKMENLIQTLLRWKKEATDNLGQTGGVGTTQRLIFSITWEVISTDSSS